MHWASISSWKILIFEFLTCFPISLPNFPVVYYLSYSHWPDWIFSVKSCSWEIMHFCIFLSSTVHYILNINLLSYFYHEHFFKIFPTLNDKCLRMYFLDPGFLSLILVGRVNMRIFFFSFLKIIAKVALGNLLECRSNSMRSTLCFLFDCVRLYLPHGSPLKLWKPSYPIPYIIPNILTYALVASLVCSVNSAA